MVYIYDSKNGQWIVRDASLNDPMPGTVRGSITVGEFLGPCKTDILWSDLSALKALQRLQDLSGPLDTRVRYAFRRLRDNTHRGQSAHYAGIAFDIGKNLTSKEQMRMAGIALERCGFDKIEPPYSTPGWLHVEKRLAPPASALGEYPALREGEEGVHVLLLQDALILHGFRQSALTGRFNGQTASALKQFQQQNSLPICGIADGPAWHALMHASNISPF